MCISCGIFIRQIWTKENISVGVQLLSIDRTSSVCPTKKKGIYLVKKFVCLYFVLVQLLKASCCLDITLRMTTVMKILCLCLQVNVKRFEHGIGLVFIVFIQLFQGKWSHLVGKVRRKNCIISMYWMGSMGHQY